MKEKNPRSTRIKHKSEASRQTSADFGLPRRFLGSSRQSSEDNAIIAAVAMSTVGSSYDYSSPSCDVGSP